MIEKLRETSQSLTFRIAALLALALLPIGLISVATTFQLLGADPFDVYVKSLLNGRVVKSLPHTDVGVVQFDVLAHNSHPQGRLGPFNLGHRFCF